MPTPGPPAARVVHPIRGAVFFVHMDGVEGQKPVVVVSNNARNEHFDSFLAVRITTSPSKGNYPTHVPVGSQECMVGTARCDDVLIVYRDEIARHVGYLTVGCMERIGYGLRHALALTLGGDDERRSAERVAVEGA